MSSEDLKKAASGGHEVGMSLALTTIFIAGQMAGGGVLMLPGKNKVSQEEMPGTELVYP